MDNLIHADCLDAMAAMDAESIDAIVTDPPYGLEFMGKEWDKLNTAHAKRDRADELGDPLKRPYLAHNVAYQVGRKAQDWHEAWAREAFRIAKPGAHLLAFGGTRTVHRLAAAIEDAGWEIRDMLVWGYASGFPKSLDVSKAIDRANGKHDRDLDAFGAYVRQAREAKGWTLRQLDQTMGTNTAASWWEGRKSGVQPPSVETYRRLKDVLGLDDRYDGLIAWVEAEREKIGERDAPVGHAFAGPVYGGDSSSRLVDLTAPATPDAEKWDGWGTALKPAWEPIVMARKPLRGTVAANVLRHGTGALNIDGTRIGYVSEADKESAAALQALRTKHPGGAPTYGGGNGMPAPTEVGVNAAGRWPANVVLTDAIFDGGVEGVVGGGDARSSGIYERGEPGLREGPASIPLSGGEPYGDSGTYSRFFLIPKSARAEREPVLGGFELQDREGKYGSVQDARPHTPEGYVYPRKPRANVHPTVKPLDLMRHLVRLVTPPGGRVLDPFLGSGTTALAAEMEGFAWIGIEKEAEYVAITEARLNGTQKGLGLA